MPQPKNPFFHSQERRKSESAAIPIRDRNVKRNTAISPTVRNRFAPPVPPKDGPLQTASAVPVMGGAMKNLSALEREWMLDDCLGKIPTPTSEDGLAQEYSSSSTNIVNGSESHWKGSSAGWIHPSLRATPAQPRNLEVFQESDAMPQHTNSKIKFRATKRDTVADLVSDIMGSDQRRLSRQETLDEVATLSAMPPPLRIPSKPKTPLRGNSLPPVSKFNKLELGGRPSLQIITTFANPRTAPEPITHRRSLTKQMSHAHGSKDRPTSKSMTRWKRSFSNDIRKVQPQSTIPSPPPKSSARRSATIQTPKPSQYPLPKQRRANTFPAHKTMHRLRNEPGASAEFTLLHRRATQTMTVNRMRDPDETFNQVLALRRSRPADANPDKPIPTPANQEKSRLELVIGKADCTGLYTTTKHQVDDIVQNMKNLRRKNRVRREREEMKREICRKYEEMKEGVGEGD